MIDVDFCFDQPRVFAVPSHVVRTSGWILARDGRVADSIHLLINGQPAAAATRCHRLDVASVFKQHPLAAKAGFLGDIVIEPDAATSELSCRALFGGDIFTAVVGHLTLPRGYRAVPPQPRQRSYDLTAIFSEAALASVSGRSRDLSYCTVEGVPHFHAAGDPPLLRLSDAGPTHAYPNQTLDLISALRHDELFLDLGCGIRPPNNILPNGVYLDAVHFQGVDIVSSAPTLPFRDAAFDLVVSHAVFEHLKHPQATAREVLRTLKPGACAYIDTAFMQPFHGDPDHYFNMTASGLRAVLDGFEILNIGVAPWQTPSYGWRMQFDAIAGFHSSKRWARLITEFRDELEKHGQELDAALGPLGQEIVAAGVCALVRKPR